jgi:hypothetical protein
VSCSQPWLSLLSWVHQRRFPTFQFRESACNACGELPGYAPRIRIRVLLLLWHLQKISQFLVYTGVWGTPINKRFLLAVTALCDDGSFTPVVSPFVVDHINGQSSIPDACPAVSGYDYDYGYAPADPTGMKIAGQPSICVLKPTKFVD